MDKSQTTEPRAAVKRAQTAIRADLPRIAREILTWRETAVLTNGRLREIADMLRPISPGDHLSWAEKLAVDAALEAAADAE